MKCMYAGPVTRVIAQRVRRARAEKSGREDAMVMLKAAEFLPGDERALLRAHFADGRSLRQMARAAGCAEQAMGRRVREIRRRVAHPCFMLTVQFARDLPGDLAAVTRGYFYEGRPLSVVARRAGVSVYRARVMLAQGRAMLVMAGVERFGGNDPRGRTLIAALLGALPEIQAERRVALAARNATRR